MARVLLVRHGETTWNREGRIQGWAPAALTDRGREQAAAVAEHLAAERTVDRLVASDLRRAKETARAIGAATGTEATFDRGWRERSFGVYQGMDYEALFGAHPEFSISEVGYAAAEAEPEGGESMLGARERAVDAWERLRATLEGDETVAVVAHGGPIKMVVGHLDGLTLSESVFDVAIPNCSVTEVAVESDPELLSVGAVVAGEETGGGTIY